MSPAAALAYSEKRHHVAGGQAAGMSQAQGAAMERQFEYGGYLVVASAVPNAAGGFAGQMRIADAFGEPAGPTYEAIAGDAPTQEAAVALAEATAMRAIDAGEVR
ncbi:conserved hypothetical protein [Cupriavidus oxalaticus]|uniref:Uncharacterized protein n=2 Tax=Cupriavidus oxalaticus TaxID=96344 RepID=A0A976BF94_9BURK|nr:conserved hypothetical protein [Cupriavidus oxalaticus]